MPALPLRPGPLREESGRGRSSAAQCRRHPLLRQGGQSGRSSAAQCRRHPLLRQGGQSGRSSAAQCRRHPLLRQGGQSGNSSAASASTPRRAREIIRGAMPQASASTPRRAEREFIRDKARASTVVGQARCGYEPWVIVRGECARASAARGRGGQVGREGALAIGDILSGSIGEPRDTRTGLGQRSRRVPVAGRSHTARVRQLLIRLVRLMGLL